ncbi:MAG: GTPase HflX [Chloroflexi bacterium]|nr:GTPase HflX [Chloroflexota bacterium]
MGVELASSDGLWPIEESLAELQLLAETAGYEVLGTLSQKLKTPNPAHYLGKGKLEQLLSLQCDLGFGVVIFDDELSPGQQRRLEETLKVRVLDRTALILEIFAQRARTREGRIQVELAQYQYMLPRLTRQWTHLERQMGDIGARGGPGETQLEVDRRKVRERIEDLRRELEAVRRHRALYRHQRQREGIPVVSLVGYTNAGKSTLLNALTGAGVLAEDRLFATLDPLTRRIVLPTGREALISDTVGFIHKLPTTLVAAFRATLEELESADLLVHVIDVTHPSGWEQSQAVEKVLAELHVADKPVVTVLNKIDHLLSADPYDREGHMRAGGEPPLAELEELRLGYPNAVLVSAQRGWGLAELLSTIDRVLGQAMVSLKVRLPYRASHLVHLFHQRGTVTSERYTADGTLIEGCIPPQLASQFRGYAVR